MIKRRTLGLLVLLVGGLLLTTTAVTFGAQEYDLSWWTVDGGGAALSMEGGYSLNGSLGQPDAGALISNDYMLNGGLWGGGNLTAAFEIYLPLVQRNF